MYYRNPWVWVRLCRPRSMDNGLTTVDGTMYRLFGSASADRWECVLTGREGT